MPGSRDGYGPVLLKEIARTYTEAHAKEEPQILALMDEFGRDAVLAAVYDVQRMRLEAFEGVFGKPPFSGNSLRVGWGREFGKSNRSAEGARCPYDLGSVAKAF